MRLFFCCIVIIASALLSGDALGQKGDQFTSLIPLQHAEFGEWDGVDLIGGSIIPDIEEGFCIVYVKKQDESLHQVDYSLEIQPSTGASIVNGSFVIQNSTGSQLPVTFTVNKTSSNISSSPNPPVPWPAGNVYSTSFPNAVTRNKDIGPNSLFPNGCNDAKFVLDISILGSDIVNLPDPAGTFAGTFQLLIDPVFNSGNITVDTLEFDVTLSVVSSVYITQLSPAIDLANTLAEEFCIWSFGGEDVSLTIAGTETAVDSREFSMVNRDAGGTPIDTIGYDVQLDSLRDGQTVATVANGAANSNLPTVPGSEHNCSGSNGLNYRLTFDVENKSSARPGDYSDTLVLTAAPM